MHLTLHTAVVFDSVYFHKLHKKVAFCENTIVNSYVSVALLQCYILETIF